ncbi:MAG TPA: potassium/proton antiporter, partial [Burkholderiales bacterium]|nr:potassium/proton antiporter [Burkholderiales bacterium]
ILASALLVLLSIVVSSLSARIGAPLLLVFLAAGMLAGEEGPGHILFSDYQTAYLVGTMALAVILFDGGMRTHTETFRVGLWPAVSLATVGVILTAGIVGLAAAWLFKLDLMKGLLIGAIIGSTDAAAVFSVLSSHGMRLKQRVGATLEIESGCNDPMAVFLTLVLIEVVGAGDQSLGWSLLWAFVWQFGFGGLAGIVGGRVLVWLLNRVSLTNGLYPLLAMAGGLVIYGTTTVWGASGFLAIYLAGLILGNARVKSQGNILKVHDGLAWLAQISLFLMLGLLVTPSALIPTAVDSLLAAIVLMAVARPIAVWVSLLPFRFPKREQIFIAWVGLRGAVPIVLALFPALAGLPESSIYFNVAFFVVLTSLVVQGWTVAPLAQALRLRLPQEHAPYYSEFVEVPGQASLRLLGYRVTELSKAISRSVNQLPLPPGVRIVAAFRDGKPLDSIGHIEIAAADLLYVITTDEHMALLDHLFVPADDAKESEQQRVFGTFTLDGDAPLGEVADIYGVDVPERTKSQTLARYIDQQFHRRPVVGDFVRIGGMNLVVREMRDGRTTKVGIVVRNR